VRKDITRDGSFNKGPDVARGWELARRDARKGVYKRSIPPRRKARFTVQGKDTWSQRKRTSEKKGSLASKNASPLTVHKVTHGTQQIVRPGRRGSGR